MPLRTSAMLKRCMSERSALGSCEMISLTIQSATRGSPLHRNRGYNAFKPEFKFQGLCTRVTTQLHADMRSS